MKQKTLKTKIVLAVTQAVLISALVLGGLSILFARDTLSTEAYEVFQMTCENEIRVLNGTIEKIEQSVNSLSAITVETIGDWGKFKNNSFYEQECTQKLEVPTLKLATYTNGAVNAYIRYNPEFTAPTSGIFMGKEGDAYEFYTPTDFSMYEPEDVAHVGWYYIPVQAGTPTWMDPYLNENINVYMISYVVPLFMNDESVGIVGMDIDFTEIENLVTNAKVFETGYAYLVNAENNIMCHKDYETGTPLSEADAKAQECLNDPEKEGKVQHIGKDMYIYLTLENGMKYVMTVPYNEMIKKVNVFSNILLGLFLLIFVVAVVYAFFIGSSIANPIRQLTNIIQKTANFNFERNAESQKLMKLKKAC